MAKVIISENCPKWLKLQIEASLLLLTTGEAIKKSLTTLPWLSLDYIHKDTPEYLLAKHSISVVGDNQQLVVVRGEDEVLATVVFAKENKNGRGDIFP